MFAAHATHGHLARGTIVTTNMNTARISTTYTCASMPPVCVSGAKGLHATRWFQGHSPQALISPLPRLYTTLPRRKVETLRVSCSASESDSFAAEDKLSQPVVEDWVQPVSDFWTSEGVSERDLRELVKLGETHEHLRDVELLEACTTRMRLLIPDCKVEIMVQREPNCLNLTFTHAAHLLLQLQEFVGSERKSEVTTVFERFPALLLVEDIPSAIRRATDHIINLKPVFEVSEVEDILKRHPHLIYRVLYFDEFDVLPYDIKNHLWHRMDAEKAKAIEWNDQWDTWGDAEDAMKSWYEEHWDDVRFDDD
uniref:Uncharacterized protein n=1 Tax=Pyramimonas obovata TaxID=1411642 RepID=A0A7S0WQC2_9CHLO|mmetsp:Transcript_3476/g.7241  ORF Transcript_3476/g.7241 Transcript_3476/m.7241 type:complete len:310 (+) Transcript_3476:174-1103(+)